MVAPQSCPPLNICDVTHRMPTAEFEHPCGKHWNGDQLKKPRKQPKKGKGSKGSKKKGKKSDKTGKGKQSKSKKSKKSQKEKSKSKPKEKDKKRKKDKKDKGGDGDEGGGGGDDESGGGDVADRTEQDQGASPEPAAEQPGGETTPRRLAAPTVTVAAAPEVMAEMREHRKRSRFKSDEINAKITLEQLKDDTGQPRFSSGRFGAVFLLPESCTLQKVQSFKEEDDVQSQSD
ncbi:hypothetical protein GCK32_005550 [Trichostrongylus colubriformis]|uniref:Uncharacterized protein n=1 Tax=Trichostrongylus colubriformis TaxID=6319 RepID=A0AAN8FWU8_TRICO